MKNNIFSKIFLIILTLLSSISLAFSSWIVTTNKSVGETTINKSNDVPIAYIIGKPDKYSTIEKALDVATSGDIVTVVPPRKDNYNNLNNANPVDKVSYTISRNVTIKEGVTFLIPTDKKSLDTVTNENSLVTYISSMRNGDRDKGNNESYGLYSYQNEKNYLRTTINVNDNVTITNYGNIIVSGYTSSGKNAPGKIGHTSHSYSKIVLGRNSKIIQKGANSNLHTYGYIEEVNNDANSLVDITSGTLHIPMVVDDYKGFSTSFAMTDGAIDKDRVPPFSQFEFNNITSRVNIAYASKVEAYASIWATYSNPSFNKVFPQSIHLVGNTNSYIVQFNDSTYSSISYKYNRNLNKAIIDFNGGFIMNNFSLNIKESIVSINLNTKNAFFPVPFNLEINLNGCVGDDTKTATYDLTKQRIKLLPGSRISINKGALLKGNEISIYTAFYDGPNFNGPSSLSVGGITYPTKKGAEFILNGGKVDCTSIGGNIYGSTNDVIRTNDTILTKEVWSLASSGNLNPPWTIVDFLEINEKLTFLPISDLDKPKFYAGTNIYSRYNNFIPSYKVNFNNGQSKVINKYQETIVLNEGVTSYKYQMINNIYKMFNGRSYYNYNASITYNETNSIGTAICSNVAISNNNNGVNEFVPQSVTIECLTPLIENKVPLFIDSSISLRANVVDDQKTYTKTIVWSSDDPSVATVDKEGNVTGVSLGKTTIRATCNGVEGTFEAEVIEDIQISKLESIFITDDRGNTSQTQIGTTENKPTHGKYGNHQEILFTVNLVPADAAYKSIKWFFRGSGDGRNYLSDSTKSSETVEGVTSVTVHTVSGTNTSDDYVDLRCEVTDMDGVVHKETFGITHKADLCFTKDTKILMGDGTYKSVQDITSKDVVMAFNHETGRLEPTKLLLYVNHGKMSVNEIKLVFNDGTKINFGGSHELFSYENKEYTEINDINVKDYLGHDFAGFDEEGKLKVLTLVDYEINAYNDETFTLVSDKNLNIIAEGMLTFTPNLHGLTDYFAYNDDLSYNKELMLDDIKKYGLYTYDDFKDKVPEYMFNGFNFKYFKVSIGKGLMTYEDLLGYIEYSKSLIEDGEMEYNPDL